MDCVCWRQCRNCSAFLPRTPGEGLYGHFRIAAHNPPSNPLHSQAPQAAHGTEGGQEERENHATYEEEDIREDGEETSDWQLTGGGSGASSAFFTGYNKSSMEGADGKSG